MLFSICCNSYNVFYFAFIDQQIENENIKKSYPKNFEFQVHMNSELKTEAKVIFNI